MIKELIDDLSTGKVTLTQALNRAKVFAHKINNSELKNWIKEQLEGYEGVEMENLPAFRNLKCKTYLTHIMPNGIRHDKEVIGGEQHEEYLNRFGYTGSIPLLEQQLGNIEGNTLMAALDPLQYNLLAQADRFGKWVNGGYRQFDRGQLIDIVERTKQRLFDTLLDLDAQFPELENKIMKSGETNKEVQQIVNNHIYGNSSGLIIGTGSSITQSDITNTTSTINTWQELEKLGVEQIDAINLREILENRNNDKPTLKDKAMKWFGTVSASLATKGLAENIPKLYEYVTHLLQN